MTRTAQITSASANTQANHAVVRSICFYPVDVTATAPAVQVAKRICAACPVQASCLLDAMAGEDPARRWGVIGGTTPDERHTLFLAQRPSVARSGAVAA